MRRSNVESIGNVVNELLKTLNIDQKIKEVRLTGSWGEVLGKNVSRATQKVYIKNKVLFVYLNSSVIRNELLMLKSGIIKALNERAGEKVIEDIVFK
jgi:predicted nucleic acid-binding Zn ribbon protein